MDSNPPRNLQDHLAACRTRVAETRESGDARQLCIALVDLGLALFRTRAYEDGQSAFEEATTMALAVDDRHFQAQVLGMRASAYQEIGRHHNAYEVLNSIVELAEAHQDQVMLCTAITAQARVLLESGEPVIALDRLKEARQLADQLADKSHLMKIHGALGNYKIAVAALDDAHTHFDMALMVAQQIGDKRAQVGYLVNKGTLFIWQKAFLEALPVFERARVLAAELDDAHAELTSLRYLTECLHKTGSPQRIPPLAQRGIALAHMLRDPDAAFSFFQTLVVAYYRLQQQADAHRALQDAVAYAQTIKDRNKEADMLLNLGESCIVFELYDQASDAYQRALDVLRSLGRVTDVAHVLGRLGVALAEADRTDEAIAWHRQAVELAQLHKLPELQGEQLIMLAFAHLEQQRHDEARAFCEQALDVFTAAGLDARAASVRDLLAQLDEPA